MKVSSLQPKGIVFQEVSVQVNLDEKNNPIPTDKFDFSGVVFTCDVGYGEAVAVDNPADKNSMLVSVVLKIPNEEGTKAPYSVKIAVTGIFTWLDEATSEAERRDLTVVNGASILYGSIREMLLNVTSRSISGTMLLPSFNFLDHKPSIIEAQQANPATISQEI